MSKANQLNSVNDKRLAQLDKIDVEDLQYVERDLNYAEKVSLAFLLYGENHANAVYALQKLLAMSGVHQSNSIAMMSSSSFSTQQQLHSDQTNLLQQYANANPKNWRSYLIEALVIINARSVLRKLGFSWPELRNHYLPHISALSLHIHPLLKTLYIICESLTIAQSGRLVMSINDKYQRKHSEGHLRFYDFSFLEIFLLDWLTRRIIQLGDANAIDSNVQALIEYFKFNDELEGMASLLITTINSNAEQKDANGSMQPKQQGQGGIVDSSETAAQRNDSGNSYNGLCDTRTEATVQYESGIQDLRLNSPSSAIINTHEYVVRRECAGNMLIINQKSFHRNVPEELQHLLPQDFLSERIGTDVDVERLVRVFGSFGYNITPMHNLDHLSMLSHIREVVKRSLLCDSLIVCILSHGIDGAVYGSNSIAVKISDIERIINADETLQNKPKMIIIQACQKNTPTIVEPEIKIELAAEAYADMLKAMSTVPGHESLRHTKTGTWFIQELCGAVEKYGKQKHMLDILTTVTNKVSSLRGNKNETMLPQTQTTLRKNFFLPH